MTLPAWNDNFHQYYNTYSVPVGSMATIPDFFDVFSPDNTDDFQCLSVISPNPDKGARRWTMNGKWITIGIYRDEGRPTALRPQLNNVSWDRDGQELILNVGDTNHLLEAGNSVKLSNINVTELTTTVYKIYSQSVFSVLTHNDGATSGSSANVFALEPYNFYEQNRVFRFLPSFKLIPYLDVVDLFNELAPVQGSQQRSMFDISSLTTVKIPTGTSKASNYNLPFSRTLPAELKILETRFNQEYDEDGNPLALTYSPAGIPIPVNNVDSKNKNSQDFVNQPIDGVEDSILQVYDFYGIYINGNRAPFNRDDIIAINPESSTEVNNFLYLKINGTPIYSQRYKLFDLFGNVATGVHSDTNTLRVRKGILPLQLDAFNRPTKKPILR